MTELSPATVIAGVGYGAAACAAVPPGPSAARAVRHMAAALALASILTRKRAITAHRFDPIVFISRHSPRARPAVSWFPVHSGAVAGKAARSASYRSEVEVPLFAVSH